MQEKESGLWQVLRNIADPNSNIQNNQSSSQSSNPLLRPLAGPQRAPMQ